VLVTQNGNRLEGVHQGDFTARDLNGIISADSVQFLSSIGENHGEALSHRFTGKITGETMSGSLAMGEYLGASWTRGRSPSAADAWRADLLQS
jgi:D-glucosaminate-6-phosphate ammonia-lyase